MFFTRRNNRPLPRGSRRWHAALAVLLICFAIAVVTVRAARHSTFDEDVRQPTDPGIVTNDAGTTDR